jgi:hypothetical protein
VRKHQRLPAREVPSAISGASTLPATPPRPDQIRCGRLIASSTRPTTDGPPVAASLDGRTSSCGTSLMSSPARHPRARAARGSVALKSSFKRPARLGIPPAPATGALDRRRDGSHLSQAAFRPHPGDTRLLLTSPFRPASLSLLQKRHPETPRTHRLFEDVPGARSARRRYRYLQRPHQPLLSAVRPAAHCSRARTRWTINGFGYSTASFDVLALQGDDQFVGPAVQRT